MFIKTDQAACAAAVNRKSSDEWPAIELMVVLPTVDLSPSYAIDRCLDKPRFQMSLAWTTRTDCVVYQDNPPLLEIVAHPIVPRVWNVFFLCAIR
jgi:hypothetical protein